MKPSFINTRVKKLWCEGYFSLQFVIKNYLIVKSVSTYNRGCGLRELAEPAAGLLGARLFLIFILNGFL